MAELLPLAEIVAAILVHSCLRDCEPAMLNHIVFVCLGAGARLPLQRYRLVHFHRSGYFISLVAICKRLVGLQ